MKYLTKLLGLLMPLPLSASAFDADKPAPQWLGQHYADAARRAKRRLVRKIGIRQYKKQQRAARV